MICAANLFRLTLSRLSAVFFLRLQRFEGKIRKFYSVPNVLLLLPHERLVGKNVLCLGKRVERGWSEADSEHTQ
jgi:hypothetical protein